MLLDMQQALKTFLVDQAVYEDSNNPVLIYQYRGNPNSVRTDGTLNPYSIQCDQPGISSGVELCHSNLCEKIE